MISHNFYITGSRSKKSYQIKYIRLAIFSCVMSFKKKHINLIYGTLIDSALCIFSLGKFFPCIKPKLRKTVKWHESSNKLEESFNNSLNLHTMSEVKATLCGAIQCILTLTVAKFHTALNNSHEENTS